jgi:sulfoxide reductase heme-binding subunit YedZ
MRSLNPSMKWLKPPIFVACLLPLTVLLLQLFSEQINSGALLAKFGLDQDLGANPIQKLTFTTGDTTLIFLCITLAITPLRRLTGQPWLIKFRRMFGLFAFFYACLHFSIYWIDLYYGAKNINHSLDLAGIFRDVAKRPFITAGFTAFVLLIPLAITSTSGWIRRLGGKRWLRLHQLIYFAAVAAVIHYWWQVKSDIRKPLLYAVIVGILLGYRVIVELRKRKSAQAAPAPARPIPSMETAEDA